MHLDDAGVVEQDVDRAQFPHGGLDHPLDGGSIGDVDGEPERAPAESLHRPHRFGKLRFAHVGERDVRPVLGHALRDGPSDPARAARDERDLSVETH